MRAHRHMARAPDPRARRRGTFVRSISGHWYIAATDGPISRLQAVIALGFETPKRDQLAEQGAILASGRCWRR